MAIDIQVLGQYGVSLRIGAPGTEKTVYIDPVLGGKSPETLFAEAGRPNYLLLTHWYPHWADALALLQQSGATLVIQDRLADFLKSQPQADSAELTPITMSFGHEVDFPWAGSNLAVGDPAGGTQGSLVMTVADHFQTLSGQATPFQANGFILQAEGHQVYHAGPTQLTPELRTIGLTYKPDVAILPLGGHGAVSAERVAQCVMWLGSDIVLPLDVSGQELESGQSEHPLDWPEIYTTIDAYTPAICRILNPGDNYVLQPTVSSGRTAGPESRY